MYRAGECQEVVAGIELPRKVSQSQIKTPSVQALCGTGSVHTISHAQLASGDRLCGTINQRLAMELGESRKTDVKSHNTFLLETR